MLFDRLLYCTDRLRHSGHEQDNPRRLPESTNCPQKLRDALKPAQWAEVTATALSAGSEASRPLRSIAKYLDTLGFLEEGAVSQRYLPLDIARLRRPPRCQTSRCGATRSRRLREQGAPSDKPIPRCTSMPTRIHHGARRLRRNRRTGARASRSGLRPRSRVLVTSELTIAEVLVRPVARGRRSRRVSVVPVSPCKRAGDDGASRSHRAILLSLSQICALRRVG